MNRLLFFFVMFFPLVVSEKAFCASSEWFNRIYERIPDEIRGTYRFDGVEVFPLPDYRRLLDYQEENESRRADWSKQQLRMVVNAQEYDLNEPIYMRFFLKNVSDDDLLYYMASDDIGSNLKLSIVHEDDTLVEKTQGGPMLHPSMNPAWGKYYLNANNYLRPGRETEIYRLQNITLEQVYPLIRPGKYRMTASFFYSPIVYSEDREEIKSEPIEFVIRDKQFEPPLEPVRVQVIQGREYRHPENPKPIERKDLWKYAKDQWENNFFGTTKFRLAFDPSKDQHCFNPDEPIDLLLYTFDNERWLRRFPWPVDEEFPPPQMNNVPLFALDNIPYRGVRLVLFTPEGRKVSKVLSSPGDAPDTCAELPEGILNLRKVFDLSTPGKYRLSGDLRSVRPGQQFVPSLESNEVEFEIVRGPHFSPNDLIEPNGPTEQQ